MVAPVTIPQGLTVIQWITDFSERVKQLQTVSQASQSTGPSALKVSYINDKISMELKKY
jgi:dynein heavy chain 1